MVSVMYIVVLFNTSIKLNLEKNAINKNKKIKKSWQ